MMAGLRKLIRTIFVGRPDPRPKVDLHLHDRNIERMAELTPRLQRSPPRRRDTITRRVAGGRPYPYKGERP